MTTEQLLRSAPHDDRPWDRLLARVLSGSLDRQLASGCPAGTSRALAIRAREITSAARRRELAQRWDHVLDQARRPAVPRTPRAPLCRDRVAAAEPDVREMITVLARTSPIAARGVAMASLLLTDGNGPLHNHRSPVNLSAAVQEAARHLDSSAWRPGSPQIPSAAGADNGV
jgi:hypothetical protein